MSAGPWRVEITPTGNGRFNAMIVRPVPGESDQVARGYNQRSFASQAAAEKSAWGYIRERRMNEPPPPPMAHFERPATPSGQDAAYAVGTVVHFRGRKGRRYVIVRVEPSYGAIARYSLKALSGGVKGSGPTGTRESEIERDANQSTETSGAKAAWLRMHLGHPASWGLNPRAREIATASGLQAPEPPASPRRPTKPRKSQKDWLAQFGIKD